MQLLTLGYELALLGVVIWVLVTRILPRGQVLLTSRPSPEQAAQRQRFSLALMIQGGLVAAAAVITPEVLKALA